MSIRRIRRCLGVLKHGDSSEEEEEVVAYCVLQEQYRHDGSTKHRGSVIGRQPVRRNVRSGHWKLWFDYFAPNAVYNRDTFCRRYRVTPELFERIASAVAEYDDYFVEKENAAGKLGCSTVQKVTACFRMLANGCSADSLDSDLRMSDTTIIESLKRFIRAVVHLFNAEYMRHPNAQDISRLLDTAASRGFPGMIGSIDCMHWTWEKCPTGWQGMYKGHEHRPTIILEAVAGPDLWFWHAFFGLPGSLNDINVLHRSLVFDDLATGNAPQVNFNVNGHEYGMGYYLADGIYPDWATLVKGIHCPMSEKHKLFTLKQAEYRKDVERAFGVLQAKFAVVKGPARMWYPTDLKYIMDCCVILHNMAVEEERGLNQLDKDDYQPTEPVPQMLPKHSPTIEQLIDNHKQIESRSTHYQLQEDLIEHVWAQHGPHGGNSTAAETNYYDGD